jgi:hypothetical protein
MPVIYPKKHRNSIVYVPERLIYNQPGGVLDELCLTRNPN